MESCVAYSTKPHMADATDELISKIKAGVPEPKIIMLYSSAEGDANHARSVFASEFAGVPLVGISSSMGVVTSDGFFGGDEAFLGAIAVGGRGIDVGVALSDLAGDSFEAGKLLAQKAMADAGRQDAPDFWFMLSSSSKAGECMNGIAETIGVVPLCGGGIAKAEGMVFSADGLFKEGCTVVFVYSKAQFVSSFDNIPSSQAADAIQNALQDLKGRRVPPVARSIKVHLSGIVSANPAAQKPVLYAMALDERCLSESSDEGESLVNQLSQAAEGAPFMALLAQEEYGVHDGSYCTDKAGLSFATIG